MIDKILGQTVNTIVNFFNSSAGKKMLMVASQQAIKFVVREKFVEKGWEGVTEFVSSTQLKITYRTKESEVVIDAATTQFYRVGNVRNSQVLQGKGNVLLVNNISFNVNINADNVHDFIESLKTIDHEFKTTEKEVIKLLRISPIPLDESTIVQAEKINKKVEQLSLTLSTTLSNAGIDYSLLQQALKTQ